MEVLKKQIVSEKRELDNLKSSKLIEEYEERIATLKNYYEDSLEKLRGENTNLLQLLRSKTNKTQLKTVLYNVNTCLRDIDSSTHSHHSSNYMFLNFAIDESDIHFYEIYSKMYMYTTLELIYRLVDNKKEMNKNSIYNLNRSIGKLYSYIEIIRPFIHYQLLIEEKKETEEEEEKESKSE